MNNTDMTNLARVEEIVEKLAPELKTLTLNIHDNPELGEEEYKAQAWQKELLEKYGFDVTTGFCDIPTAYKAVYRGSKPGIKIAMLAEYDALPEIGHGCGHSLIAMMSVGAGIAIRDFVDEYGGEIHVVGTPAEETKGAKVEMSQKGAFKEYDVAMMAHPAFIAVDSINTQAMAAVQYEFFGKPSHAAAAPELGINALDAMINFFNLVNALRQQTKEDARIHGIITDGGTAANVIPEYTAAKFYIRSNRNADVIALRERVNKCAEGAALATGCTFKITPVEADFKDTISNRRLSDLVVEKVEALGTPVLKLGGITIPGSSDLGDVSYECPAIQISCKIKDCANVKNFGDGTHTREFAEAAASDFAINEALKCVKAFTLASIDLMTKPEILAEIKEEFSHVNE